MELREIETFLAIVEQGAFSKAAEKLGYSQSAVTVQIKQLEKELGAHLFDRVPRGAVLTEQGRAFAFHANEIAGAARAAKASIASSNGEPQDMSGILRLGSVESVATAILPEILVRYHSTCPHVQVIVTTAQRSRMIEGLRNNTIDILLTMERHVHQAGLATRALRREQVVFVASPALLDSVGTDIAPGRPLDARSLCELPFVLTERGESYRLELDRALSERDLHIDPLIEAGNTETLVHLAERGVGATFVPRFSAQRELKRGSLVEVATQLEPVEMETQLIHHTGKWIAPHMEVFVEMLEELVR